jgi:hypothetical protein
MKDKLAAAYDLEAAKEYIKLYNYHESLAHENVEYEVGGSSDGA